MSQQTTLPGADNPRDPRDPAAASEPSSAREARPPSAAARGGAPTSGSLRRVLDAVLRGDADLDAFCHDHHADVYRRFSDGMERSRKVTLLLQHADRATILASLYEAHRAATERHEHLLTWPRAAAVARPRRLAALALGLVAIALAAWKIFPDPGARAEVARRGVLEAWRAWSTVHRAIEPFAAEERGIVVGGPWMATPAGDALCRELRKLHGADAVRCVAPSGDAGAAPIERTARSAGAILVADIEARGLAQVTPLGRLAKEPLLGRRLAIDIAAEEDRKRAGIVMSALARLGAPREAFVADAVPCPVGNEAQLDPLALLALLVVPSCESAPIRARSLECPPGTTVADEACALARYVDAELHLADTRRARHLLTELRDRGAARFRTVAKLALARLDCKEHALPEAAAALRELAQGADACVLAHLSETAACVTASAGPGAVDADVRALEALPIDPQRQCPERMRARALAARGYWREQGQRWSDALADYEQAWHLLQDPRYGLNLAEMWIHEGEPGRAAEVLSGVRCDAAGPPGCHARVALLRWIVAGDAIERKEAEAVLLRLHEQLGPGAAVLGGSRDRLLRALVCPGPASAGCLHDVLARPAPRGELLEQLRAADRLHPPRRAAGDR